MSSICIDLSDDQCSRVGRAKKNKSTYQSGTTNTTKIGGGQLECITLDSDGDNDIQPSSIKQNNTNQSTTTSVQRPTSTNQSVVELSPYFKCSICSFTVKSILKMNKHIKQRHSGENVMIKRLFRCEICKKGFPRPSALQFHQANNEKCQVFKCEFCYRPFTDSMLLTKHQDEHLKRGLQKFKEESNLNDHAPAKVFTTNSPTNGIEISPILQRSLKPPPLSPGRLNNPMFQPRKIEMPPLKHRIVPLISLTNQTHQPSAAASFKPNILRGNKLAQINAKRHTETTITKARAPKRPRKSLPKPVVIPVIQPIPEPEVQDILKSFRPIAPRPNQAPGNVQQEAQVYVLCTPGSLPQQLQQKQSRFKRASPFERPLVITKPVSSMHAQTTQTKPVEPSASRPNQSIPFVPFNHPRKDRTAEELREQLHQARLRELFNSLQPQNILFRRAN